MSKNLKEYEIQVPVDGLIHIYKTDLVCNSCGKKLSDGEYLYFCMKDKDDLCSNYRCLKKHAGHRFFRWGRIEMGSGTITPDINIATCLAPPSASRSINTLFQSTLPTAPVAPAGPPSLPGKAPARAPPSQQPGAEPVIVAGIPAFASLRNDMLMELSRLKTIVQGEDEEKTS